MQPNQNPNLPSNPNQQPAPPPETGASPVEQAPAPAAPEAAPSAPQSAPAQEPAQLPQIPNVPAQQLPAADPAASTQPVATGVGANPATAEEVDVIEKEWVDQANKVIQQTQNDPYVEEEAVEALQIDYLKKRYGHDVKKPDQN